MIRFVPLLSGLTYSKEKKRKKLWKRKTLNYNLYSPIWLPMHKFDHVPHLFTTTWKLQPPLLPHLPYMDNNRNNSRDNNLIWRHLTSCMFQQNEYWHSKVTWLVTWHDVILRANPVLFAFWLAPEWIKFSIYSGRNSPFWRDLIQLKSEVRRYVSSLQPFFSKDGSNPVQYCWAVIVSRTFLSFLFSTLNFLLNNFFII